MKRTLSAIIFLGLSVAILQGTPANAQTGAASIFHVVPTPNENTFNNSLFAASASSANDIWAVGNSTIHFDGTKWTSFPAPLIKGDLTADLQGVADISPTEAWAVGNVIQGANPGLEWATRQRGYLMSDVTRFSVTVSSNEAQQILI